MNTDTFSTHSIFLKQFECFFYICRRIINHKNCLIMKNKSLLLLLTFMLCTTFAEAQSTVRYRGDVNRDGNIDISDVVNVINIIASGERIPETDGGTVFQDETITIPGTNVSFKMIAVKGGTFMMGGTEEQGRDAYTDENPTHQVTLSDFRIGQTEVTQELWEAVMGSNPSYRKGEKRPVEMVSMYDCMEFIIKLNVLTGKTFRLPTEAEWEYAARGGNKNKGYKYAGSNTIDDVAWYTENSYSASHEVATKSPNELGLYDMSGSVSEWCQDRYDKYYYSSSPKTNPQGPSTGSIRVLRGGSWASKARLCRVSSRYTLSPESSNNDQGFRLVL